MSKMVISNGLIVSPSAMKRIDSRLERFFVNGYHGTVTVSPIIVRNTAPYTPKIGRITTAEQQMINPRNTIENGCGAVRYANPAVTTATPITWA